MTLWCWLNVQGWGRPRSCSVSSLARAALCELLVWWVTRVTKYTSLFPHVQSFTRYWACLVMEIYSCHSQHATWPVSVNIWSWLDYNIINSPHPALTRGLGYAGWPGPGQTLDCWLWCWLRSSLRYCPLICWYTFYNSWLIVFQPPVSYCQVQAVGVCVKVQSNNRDLLCRVGRNNNNSSLVW